MERLTTIQTSPQPGDLCMDCQKLGMKKYLRYFKINLQMEQIIKCESDTCLYPHNDEVTSSDSSSLSSSPLASLDDINGSVLKLQSESEVDANTKGNYCPSSSALPTSSTSSSFAVKQSEGRHITTVATLTTPASYKAEPADITASNVKYTDSGKENKKIKLEILSVENINTNTEETVQNNNSEISNNVNDQKEYKLQELNLSFHMPNIKQDLKLEQHILLQNDAAATPLRNMTKMDTNSKAYMEIAKQKMILKSSTSLSIMDQSVMDIPKADFATASTTLNEQIKTSGLAVTYKKAMNPCNSDDKLKSICAFQQDEHEIDINKSTSQQEVINSSQFCKKLTAKMPKATLSSQTLEPKPFHSSLDQVMDLLSKRNHVKQQSTTSKNFTTHSPDRVLTRSATCLALFGIALSSFSLKQMLNNHSNKTSSIPMRKVY